MYNNIDLLPHHPTIVIENSHSEIKYLTLMKHFIEDMYVALRHFQTNQLNKFDAHVGDTSCQIRAYKILLLRSDDGKLNKKNISEIEYELKKYYIHLKKVIQEYRNRNLEINSNSRKNGKDATTLTDLFKKNKLILELSDEFVFIFLSYFLDYFKICDENGISVAVDIQKICRNLDISTTYARRVVNYFQQILSQLSCNFVFEILSKLPEMKELNSILPDLYFQTERKRSILPCYHVIEIILSHILQTNCRIALKINFHVGDKSERILLVFRPNVNKDDFELISTQTGDFCNEKEKVACFFISGITISNLKSISINSLVKSVVRVGVKNVILANAAAHPQYTEGIDDALKTNPFYTLMTQEHHKLDSVKKHYTDTLYNKFTAMKNLAEEAGCTIQNKKLFLINHIFCGLLSLGVNSHGNHFYSSREILPSNTTLLSS